METQLPPTGCCKPFVAVACLFPLQILVGAIFGQSAGMLPQLLEEDSWIRIDREEATWIASLPTIGTCIAATVSGSLSDTHGRIRVTQVAYFFIGMGFAVMATANNFTMLALGRFMGGIGIGCYFPALLYVSEIAPVAHRSILLALNGLMASAGLVYIYILGGYYPWPIAATASCFLAIFGLLLTLFLYDSPVWLVRHDRLETARKSLHRIENPANVEATLKQLQETASNQPKCDFTLKVFVEPIVWKPFLVILALSVLQNLAGFYIIIAYTVQFMREFHSTFDPLQVTVAIGVFRLMAIALSAVLFRYFGRKTIGAVSGFGAAACLLATYAHWKLSLTVALLAENQWIPILLFLAYVFFMSMGIFPLPWTIPYEVYPIKVRGMMCGVSFCSMYVIMFVAVKIYNILMDNLRLEGTILLFAVGSLLFGVFSVTILIETHRKTLDEIEQYFAGGRGKGK
ncbi:unnamed protein product [Bemisia tabaci]|uniref:Major facilitator superfamily (MFS) profile domain-containing protein n=1 Tax=Bemisia tabaci TaxID=7038 RepID=A0A9P0ACX9_BEMTA|nr:unnamed protein product [Bemisia tabaci]